MKKLIPLLLIICVSACTFNAKTDNHIQEAIKKATNATAVTVTDGVEANTSGYSGSKKEIFVDLGPNAPSDKATILKVAYHTADTAYLLTQADKSKMPAFFRVKVKAGGMTSDNFDFKSSHLALDQSLVTKINGFMQAVLDKRYTDLNKYMEPELDLTSIISLLQKFDADGTGGVKHYSFVALQDAVGVHNPDKKPMEVIQGWVLISDASNTNRLPVLFVADPVTGQLSSVYINPGASK